MSRTQTLGHATLVSVLFVLASSQLSAGVIGGASGSIHGTKWLDTNGDGERDDNEPGLPGVIIYSDLNGNGVAEQNEPRAVSMRDNPDTRFDESGRYWLEDLTPGIHTVREVVPDGFEQTFPVSPANGAVAGGNEFSTVNPESLLLTLDSGETATRAVSITIHPLCVRPFDIDVTAPDAPAGMVENLTGIVLNGCGDDISSFSVRFNGDGGTHVFDLVFVDSEFGGELDRLPVAINSDDPSTAHVIRLGPGQSVDGVDFGNRRIPESSIHGTKWLDANGNGQRDVDEPGLPGVVIYSDLNRNGEFDRGEPSAVSMRDDPDTDFDESGLYWLEDLPPGNHTIREVVPDGFEQTFPVSRANGAVAGANEFATVNPASLSLSLDSGQSATREVSITIHPLCFRPYDIDVVAPDAPAGMVENLTGIVVNGCGEDTSSFSVRFNGDGGVHSFDLIFVDSEFGGELGTLAVSINAGDAGAAHNVRLGPGQVVEGVDFGNRRIAQSSIHGTKWLDENGNGQRDVDEPGLPGVVIYSDLNRNGEFDRDEPNAISMRDDPDTDFDESGLYWLEDLQPGNHTIREVVPDGYEQTFPVSRANGAVAGGDDFATVSPASLSLTLGSGETATRDVSITIHPLCVRPFDIDVTAPDAPAGMVENLTGIVVNGCGDDTSTFSVRFNGDGGVHSFDLIFVDSEFGGELGTLAVSINAGDASAGHNVRLGPGQVVDGVDFGNHPLRSGSQLPGDCNQDASFDIGDVICLARFLFVGRPSRLPCGNGEPNNDANLFLFDFNGDRSIDIADAISEVIYLFGGGRPHVQGTRCRRVPTCPDVCGV